MLDIEAAGKLVDSKVTVTFRAPAPDGEGQVNLSLEEAHLIAVNEGGIMVRPKGSRTGQIIASADVDSVTGLVARPKIIIKKLKPVTDKDAAQHLADRHGYPVSQITEGSGAHWLNVHDSLDHSDLGHKHGE